MRILIGLVFPRLRLPRRSVLRRTPPDTAVLARLRQYSHTPSGKSVGFDRLGNTFPRVETSCSAHKRVARLPGRFGKVPNRENAESAYAPFRRFAVSPFCSQFSAGSGKMRETRAECFPDLILDLVDIAGAIDQDDALWLVRRKLAVSFANTLVKFCRLLFHPISFA
jgi:hypothetical protein